VSANDAMVIACLKGLVAGSVNLCIALLLGAHLPGAGKMAAAMVTGFAGYGVSLVLFVVALSLFLWPEVPSLSFWIAAVFMALGIWLHIRERHEHPHTHEVLDHNHRHRHDEHHQHMHDFEWDSEDPHTHPHQHAPITHTHPHFPDIHHRHIH
jgi:hypothetical protein